jgi:hypothetical protein
MVLKRLVNGLHVAFRLCLAPKVWLSLGTHEFLIFVFIAVYPVDYSSVSEFVHRRVLPTLRDDTNPSSSIFWSRLYAVS